VVPLVLGGNAMRVYAGLDPELEPGLEPGKG
jgi:hypothetical protein